MTNWVRLDFPAAFHLGLRGLADVAGWKVRREAGQTLVATEEGYGRRAPDLVRLNRLAGANTAHDSRSYERLSRWQPQDPYRQEDIVARVDQLDEIRQPTSSIDQWVGFRLQFMTVRDAEVAAFTEQLFASVAAQLPHASLWEVEFRPQLRWRVAAVRLLFGAREHPDVLARIHESGERIPTPMSLLQSLGYGLDSFFEPALMPTSPWVLGMNGIRVGGHAVILFGDAVPGFTGKQADDLMDLLRGRAPLATPTRRPSIEPSSAEEWLRWWVDRINDLLGLILDPSNYQDQRGFYDPGRHLGVLASIEELFSSVQNSRRRSETTPPNSSPFRGH
jgi:hypothetical protein